MLRHRSRGGVIDIRPLIERDISVIAPLEYLGEGSGVAPTFSIQWPMAKGKLHPERNHGEMDRNKCTKVYRHIYLGLRGMGMRL